MKIRLFCIIISFTIVGVFVQADRFHADFTRVVNAHPQLADFNNDNFADLVIGVPFEGIAGNDAAGAINVLYGSSPDGLTATDDAAWGQFADPAEGDDRFAFNLAAGDFDGDGYTDLAVGIPFEDIHNPGDNEGAVQILYGADSGISAAGSWFVHQDTTNINGMAEPGDRFGLALAAIPFKAPDESLYLLLVVKDQVFTTFAVVKGLQF